MSMPLEGIRVIELSRVVTGSFCTMLLGDMGADIIKVDQPVKSDKPIWGGGQLLIGEEKKKEAAFNALQRNKQSIAIDLSHDQGKEVFYRLVRKADVVLECYRPGIVKRLKIDYETVSNINSKIIYCSMSGYGQNGPYARLPGHDINYISVAGVLGLIGDYTGKPIIPLNLIGDFAGGSLHAALGITLAILARQKTGIGQYIDISITDGTVSLMSFLLSRYFTDGYIPKRGETLLAGVAPMYTSYKTKDAKYISIGCLEPQIWANLCKALNREDLIPHAWDKAMWPAIITEFSAIFQTKNRDEWFEELSKQDISVAKVLDLNEVASDPQLVHRNMVINITDDKFGTVVQPGIAIKLSQTPGAIRSLGPTLGEHTDAIMADLGYDAFQISQLRDRGIVS